MPLVETRLPFQLDQMEVDSIGRGSKDADLGPLKDAARRIARFEESAVYNGFQGAGIDGILPQCAHQPIDLPNNAPECPGAAARAVEAMRPASIEGPFVLVLGAKARAGLMQSGVGGYPPRRIISNLIDGDPCMSPVMEGGL